MKESAVMVLGTASAVGKSMVATGLCRIFKQDGFRVAPFKAQNIALNSFVTLEGKEMGRAQAVQAEAAGIEPLADMNPILIKPTAGMGSQLILNGEVYGNIKAVELTTLKPVMLEAVENAFGKLRRQFEVVVLEGAGSPVEINLKENDLVNLKMAEMADAPVLLVGDIDRGGVFASLVGTLALMEEQERKRVKGMIINKFRGDVDGLIPGIRMLEEITGIPVLGVLPYMELAMEDEDGVSERIAVKHTPPQEPAVVDIAVVRLPHLSNFTDFLPLERIPGVSLRYVDRLSGPGQPDLIILPGTKNTLDDLRYLKDRGFDKEILRLHGNDVPVMGICGGFQMLGKELQDPDNVESAYGSMEGLGLLNARTVFGRVKIRTRVEASVACEKGVCSGMYGTGVYGYEIHMGVTEPLGDCKPLFRVDTILGYEESQDPKSQDGKVKTGEIRTDGLCNAEGNVLGTYIHGVFDRAEFVMGLINNLRERKGLERLKAMPVGYDQAREKEYDRLADIVRTSLDMNKIYEIMGIDRK